MANVSITADHEDQSSNCLSVGVLDDNIHEELEQFLVSIVHVNSGVRIGEPSKSIVTIVDDDGKKASFW